MSLTRTGRRYGLLGAAATAHGLYRQASPSTRAFVDSIPSRVRTGVRQGLNRFAAFSRGRNTTRRVRGGNVASSFRSSNVGGTRSRGRRRFSRRTIRKGARRGRRGRARRTGGSFLGTLYKTLCTPMKYFSQSAVNRSGIANQRQQMNYMLGGEVILRQLGRNHPSNFLFNSNPAVTPVTLNEQGPKTWRLSIDSFVHDLRIQNRANASMELKIYECVVRRDITSGSVATSLTPSGILDNMWGVNVEALGFTTLSTVGPNQPALPTGLTTNVNHPSWTPYQSQAFVEFFKILKTHSLKLAPNEIIQRKFALRPKLFKGQHLENASSEEWQRGWTKHLIFSWVGMPVDDATTANQGKAACDLFIQDALTVKYHFLPGTTQLVNYHYAADHNTGGSNYRYDPAAFAQFIPASDVIQTITGNNEVPIDNP